MIKIGFGCADRLTSKQLAEMPNVDRKLACLMVMDQGVVESAAAERLGMTTRQMRNLILLTPPFVAESCSARKVEDKSAVHPRDAIFDLLSSMADQDGHLRIAKPRICVETGLGPRQVQNHISQLINSGRVKYIRSHPKHGATYQVLTGGSHEV